jgi:hypothetical protein
MTFSRDWPKVAWVLALLKLLPGATGLSFPQLFVNAQSAL